MAAQGCLPPSRSGRNQSSVNRRAPGRGLAPGAASKSSEKLKLNRRRGSIPKANFLPSKVFGDDVQEELFGPWQSCGDSLATETLKAGHEERPRQVLAMSQVFAQRLHTCHTKSDVLVQKALKKLVDAKKDLCMQDDQDSCNPDTALEKSVLNLREMQHRVHQMLSRQGNRQLASGETKLGEIPIQLHNGSPSLIHISALDRAKSADSTHEADGVHTQPLKGGTVQYLRDLPNNLAFRNYIGKDAVGTSGSKAKFLQECVDQYERRQANARAKKAAQEKLDDEEWNIEREAAGRKRLYAMVKALSDADATDHGWALLSHSYPFLHPASHQPPKTQEQRRHFGISMRSASYHALVTSNRTAEQDPQLPQKASSSAYRPGERRTKIHGSEHHCPLEREDGSVDYWQHQIVEFDKHSRAIEEYTSNILGEFDTRKKALESKLLESKVIESKLLESKLLGSKVLESAVASQVRAAKPPMLRKPSKSLEKATVLLHRQGTKDQQLVQVSQDSVDKAGKETAGLNTYAPDNNKPAVKPVGRTHTKPDWKQCPSAGITGAEILEQLTREDIHRSMTYNGQVVKADRKALRTRFKGVLQPRDLPTTPLEQSQARSQAKGAPQMIEKVQGHPAIARLPSFDSGSKVAGKQPSTITSASGGAHRKNSNRTRYSRKALPTIRSPKLHVDGAVVESLVWQPTYREVSRFDLDKFEKAACAQVLDKKLKKRSASTSQDTQFLPPVPDVGVEKDERTRVAGEEIAKASRRNA